MDSVKKKGGSGQLRRMLLRGWSILKTKISTGFGKIEVNGDFKQEFQWHLGAKDILQNKCEIQNLRHPTIDPSKGRATELHLLPLLLSATSLCGQCVSAMSLQGL